LVVSSSADILPRTSFPAVAHRALSGPFPDVGVVALPYRKKEEEGGRRRKKVEEGGRRAADLGAVGEGGCTELKGSGRRLLQFSVMLLAFLVGLYSRFFAAKK